MLSKDVEPIEFGEVDFEFEWDFKGWEEIVTKPNQFNQKDWNATLVTKINQTSANIFQASNRIGANEIHINPKLAPLFFTLEYYHIGAEGGYGYPSGSLSGRYRTFYNEELPEDSIYIFNSDKYKATKDVIGLVRVLNFDEDGNRKVVLNDIADMIKNGLDDATYIKELLRFY